MPRYIALVPAAGAGSRMGAGTPKQYLEVAGRPLLYYTLRKLAAHPSIERIVVVLAVGDRRFGAVSCLDLACPVDTLYCGGAERCASVYNGLLAARDGLWQAQTPQMFRYGLLVEALRRTTGSGVTDEAGAIERIGLKPKLVMGEARNLKITYPEDLELAKLVLGAADNAAGVR